MSSKRKNEDIPALTGREKKKQKTALARTIAVQLTARSGNGSNTPAQSAEAGPSKTVRFDGGSNLPGSLDVERFAEARAFEINAMHNAMQTARANGTQRAWQQLPRHLRRRAASHDVRRVPTRLREKAKEEMDPPKTKKRAAAKHGTTKLLSRTRTFLYRQAKKVWLETHLWHAKRMHMADMWGYRLAISPTEKSYRPSHRASMHGSILHDASYLGLMELKGPEHVLKIILDSCCDLQAPSPGAKRFLTGARACDTHIYQRGTYPFGLIAPITVLWQPVLYPSTLSDGRQSKLNSEPGTSNKQRKTSVKEPHRVAWIWVHPSVFDQVYVELRTAASFGLEAVAQTKDPSEKPYEVQMADLREEVNVFEIMGPKSSQIIKGALKPVVEDTRDEFTKCWNSLSNLQTTASVPRNTVLGLKVYDPRLSFPPQNAKAHVNKDKLPSISAAATEFFPTSTLAQSEIWDDAVRKPLRKPRFRKTDIDERRAQNLVPGKPLQAQAQDARIPVLLIQRSVESNPGSSSAADTPAVHGWTLIIPQGWAMPFFSSLIFTGTRVGGQRERQTQAFESGVAYFPRDYPGTLAYDEYSDTTASQEKETWERKPPAKRPNYERLGTRSPWRADWRVVLGLRDSHAEEDAGGDESTIPGEFVPAQRDVEMDVDPEVSDSQNASSSQAKQPTVDPEDDFHEEAWLLRGPNTRAVLGALSGKSNPASRLFEQIEKLRQKRDLASLATIAQPEELWKNGLVRVRLRLCGRGCPEDLAIIYGMDDEEARKWARAERSRKRSNLNAEEAEDETELSVLAPSSDSIIGYVTTGNFSLSLGEGFAIGAIPVARYFELEAQAKRLGAGLAPLIKVRERHEAICRAARIELLE